MHARTTTLPLPDVSLGNPKLMASEQVLDTLEDPSYWLSICPHLTLGGQHNVKPSACAESHVATMHQEFVENGFFHLCNDHLQVPLDEVDKLALGVVLLMQHGWPASFIFLYDEAWVVIEQAREILHAASGGSMFIGDMYAWYVNPQLGQKGWGPHRDRMGSGPSSFRADGTPMLSTTWFALTNASPNNSCLYVVPAKMDPLYHEQDLPDVDPLAAIFAQNPEAYQYIKALPCPKGCAWHFSHKMIHWGSCASTNSKVSHEQTEPRIAMSWIIGDSAFEEPAIAQSYLPFPPLNVRLGFVAGQIIAYGGQTGYRKGFRTFCFRIFKKHQSLLGSFFADKVEYLHFCRPPPEPATNAVVKEKQEIDISKLEFATPQDEEKLQGIQGLFPDSSSSDSEDE